MRDYEEFTLEFDGYWRGDYLNIVPDKPGIGCVYSCTFNVANHTVTLHELLYIGESSNVRLHIQGHKQMSKWLLELTGIQELCYSFAPIVPPVDGEKRKLISNVLNYENNPKFSLDETTSFQNICGQIKSSGANWNIKPEMQFDFSDQKIAINSR